MGEPVVDDAPRWRQIAPLHREMGYVGGALFCSGALLILIDLLTPPHDYSARGWVVAVMLGAFAAGVFYFWSGDHLPMPIWGYAIGTSVGAVMVTILVLAGGPQRTALFGVLYVFVSTYGFYYYGPAISWWLVGLNGIGFAVALAVHEVPGAISQWAMIVGTSAIAGGLLGSLSQRVRLLLRTEQATVQALSELDAWKTTFLRAVAHDLRSPLAAMLGLVQTVRDRDDALPAEQRRHLLDRAVAGGQRLERLLGDLLDVQRIEAGVVSADLERVELDELVRASVAAAELGERVVELDLAPVVAVVEPDKVDRIVTNLVRNAVHHTQAGVAIRVRLRAEDDNAVLVVEDEGRGIHDAVREDLFEAFRREGQGRGDGVGLGLHLVRRFTELHGGEVAATDRPGGGARFVVLLPLNGPPRGE